MRKIIKKNIWDFNKVFESVTGIKPLVKEGDLEYQHVDNASPESDQFVIGENKGGTRPVLAKDLKRGDIVVGLGDGLEVVQGAVSLINTPSGKVELVVKYPNGKLYRKIWNKNTIIRIFEPQTISGTIPLVAGDPIVETEQDSDGKIVLENIDGKFMSEEEQLKEIFGFGNIGSDGVTSVNGYGVDDIDSNDGGINEIDFQGDFKDVKPSGFNQKESCINPKELVDYLNRVRSNAGKDTASREKFKPKYPYVHAKSNLLPLEKDTFEDVDLEEFKNKIMRKPNSIINTNTKMLKSGQQNEFVYKTGIPAFRGIAYDEAQGNFAVINTCPGAGDCVFICYALSGNYIRYPASYDLMTQRLNLLLNHPDQYQQQMYNELKTIAKSHKALNGYENRIKMRWNDSGDFFSKKYVQIAENVIKQLNAEGFQIDDYAYTKVADVANDSGIGKTTYSSGANVQQSNQVKGNKEKSIVVPKELFADLDIDKTTDLQKLKNRIVHDNEMQRESSTPITLKSILTYSELMRTPMGDKPYWSVIVTPHNGDDAAFRKDVQNVLLTIH